MTVARTWLPCSGCGLRLWLLSAVGLWALVCAVCDEPEGTQP